MPYYSESAQHWYEGKKVGVVPAHFIKSCIRQAVRQVVFTDVLIVGDLMWTVIALLLLAYTKETLPLIGCS